MPAIPHTNPYWIRLVAILFAFVGVQADAADRDDLFLSDVEPLLNKYCVLCHGGEKTHGEVDFVKSSKAADLSAAFDVWEASVELLADDIMPPEDQPQPSAAEKKVITEWYRSRFVEAVEPHPGFFRPRRLSAYEYRNTLHSLFGFPLEVAIVEAEQTIVEKSLVMKLLPTDPPGPSGFTNDTSANPLTPVIWNQYSYLLDSAIEKLFSPGQREALEELAGSIDGQYLSTDNAHALIRAVARRARRRDLEAEQLNVALANVDGLEAEAIEAAVAVELKTLLMSPTFFYRGLLLPKQPGKQQSVDDFELAERLSYFLWADMPDEELLGQARAGRLRESTLFDAEVDRMLTSPKARSLAEDLGVQWFSLNEIDKVSNNPPVADALRRQPIDFLNYLFTEDRPLIELVDSETTFINQHTSGHYPGDRGQLARYQRQKGIEVAALPNQRITLKKTPERGGLLTMPGVLAMNRGPVQRGVWVLERVLGQHLPEPPANVGQVPGNRKGEKLTFRQRFEQHRSNAACASCHDKIDPLGFALERYDEKGGWNRSPVDASGKLPTGETFEDYQGLQKILTSSQREQVVRTIVRRTLAYALCRKLEYYDAPTVDAMVTDLCDNDGTFGDLIHTITQSLPFQQTFVKTAP